MKAKIIEGSVFDVLPTITPGSVDCVVCSPPYFALRDYSGCPCVKRGADGRSKKRPGCTNCDDNGKVPHVRDHQLGMEKTVEEYITRMVEVFRLVREVMSTYAVAFVNIGDTYSGGGRGGEVRWGGRNTFNASSALDAPVGIPAGNLCLIPQRLALALQADGWICRSVIAWVKPSPMPQSVAGWRWMRCRVKVKAGPTQERVNGSTRMLGNDLVNFGDGKTQATWADCPGCDRCRPNNGLVLRRGSWRPTSSWEPILLLAKQAGYFADGESVKTPAAQGTINRFGNGNAPRKQGIKFAEASDDIAGTWTVRTPEGILGDCSANLRDVWRAQLADMTKEELIDLLMDHADNNLPDVWTIASEPLSEKHYASFPTALVRQCLRAGTSAKGYCPVCGMPWCRVIDGDGPDKPNPHERKDVALDVDGSPMDRNGSGQSGLSQARMGSCWPKETLGWRPSCEHGDQQPRPGVVLDPFAGSGRTGLVARKLGLDFVGIELSPSYVQMARRLLHDDLPLFSELPTDQGDQS